MLILLPKFLHLVARASALPQSQTLFSPVMATKPLLGRRWILLVCVVCQTYPYYLCTNVPFYSVDTRDDLFFDTLNSHKIKTIKLAESTDTLTFPLWIRKIIIYVCNLNRLFIKHLWHHFFFQLDFVLRPGIKKVLGVPNILENRCSLNWKDSRRNFYKIVFHGSAGLRVVFIVYM